MRFRLRTRRLMVLVALAGILLATPGELRNRRERRRIARILAYHLDLAAIHDAEGRKCLASAESRHYDTMERGFSGYCDVPSFASWTDEAAYHASKSRACREAAAINEEQERAARRRLIFPVIFDIRSSRR